MSVSNVVALFNGLVGKLVDMDINKIVEDYMTSNEFSQVFKPSSSDAEFEKTKKFMSFKAYIARKKIATRPDDFMTTQAWESLVQSINNDVALFEDFSSYLNKLLNPVEKAKKTTKKTTTTKAETKKVVKPKGIPKVPFVYDKNNDTYVVIPENLFDEVLKLINNA